MNSYPPAPGYQPPGQFMQKDSSLAIISLVCGISAYCFLPFVGALAAIITGHIALNEIKSSNGQLKGSGMATAGLVLGYAQFGLVIFGILLVIALAPTIGSIFSSVSTSIVP